MNPWRILVLFVLASAWLGAAAASAHAQPAATAPAHDEAGARRLRAEAARALAAGNLEHAFESYRRAALLTADPAAWRELAEVADHLRINEIALDGYRRYLAARPNATDAAEIGGRLRVLEQIEAGARFVSGDGGVTAERPEAPPSRPSPGQRDVLVDWQGRPVSRRPSSELLSLAEWDGPRAERAYPMPRELMPFPATVPGTGIGRRLTPP